MTTTAVAQPAGPVVPAWVPSADRDRIAGWYAQGASTDEIVARYYLPAVADRPVR